MGNAMTLRLLLQSLLLETQLMVGVFGNVVFPESHHGISSKAFAGSFY